MKINFISCIEFAFYFLYVSVDLLETHSPKMTDFNTVCILKLKNASVSVYLRATKKNFQTDSLNTEPYNNR
jgi:hypothetical protein